jgi:hypothetical protein
VPDTLCAHCSQLSRIHTRTTHESPSSHYNHSAQTVLGPDSRLAEGVAGPLAQLTGSLIWVPMDVCKERMQAQRSSLPLSKLSSSSASASSPQYSGAFNVFRRILADEGVAFLYRGFLLHQVRQTDFLFLFSSFSFLFLSRCSPFSRAHSL